ncbi:GFA family protein [Pseudomonas sp. LS44]|uniref:GFA family protein n=1 Tax=Pseudomonas sp. LS44 TaxID=1357074 RepID=UPI00215A4093|nr:GFA family protein [Pseudomonas sp. LS44]UVE16639.1 GFA family protein [Pseudomonas sp. LS44]
MPDQTLEVEGGCQCGAVRYRIEGEPVMAALCHCSMCRRANAAPAVAWAMYERLKVSFLTGSPSIYESSPGAQRGFCSRCGTQICFTAEYIPGLIDITIGSLDDPTLVPPTFHYWESRRLPWLHVADQLPSYPEFPPTE